jgi:hypothetical protein
MIFPTHVMVPGIVTTSNSQKPSEVVVGVVK